MTESLVLSSYSLVSALGCGLDVTFDALRENRTGLRPLNFDGVDLETYVGHVDGLEGPVIGRLGEYDCRNNRLAQLALEQDGFADAVEAARRRYGDERVAVILGTSTSGILETELAYQRLEADGGLPADYRYRQTHDLYSVSDFVRRYLRLRGPALTISTACSSSSKVFAAAERMITAGLCDAAVVGGVDTLCLTTLYGFSSLELVSGAPCRPGAAERDGISIGEAGGFALIERAGRATAGSVELLGCGESSDAHHMSTPHPEGEGAALAMQAALDAAGLAPKDIDYVNLHGTATRVNDAMEDKAVGRLFGSDVVCSSTKGWTGHTLGAAGITEAVIACLCLERGFLPGSLNMGQPDPDFVVRPLAENRSSPVRRVLSNSFGFGGNNCSLVLGAAI